MNSERSLRNHFSGLALDRAELTRLSPDALRTAWPEARVIAVDFEGRTPGDEHGPRLWHGAELGENFREIATFLGQNPGEAACFALPAERLAPGAIAADTPWIDLRLAAAAWSRFHSGLFAYAKALLLWQSRARHCGACGHSRSSASASSRKASERSSRASPKAKPESSAGNLRRSSVTACA